METKSRLEKWWDEFFVPRKKPEDSALQQMLRKPKGAPSFTDKRMQRGVQAAIARKRLPARLAFIYASLRQGNEVAKQRREDYLRRRGLRWKALVEENLPRAFAEAMQAQGLGLEVGSGNSLPGGRASK